MSSLTRDGTAEPVSRDQILRHARGQGNINFPCSADHEQDWQRYPVDPYFALCDDHTYIQTDIQTVHLHTQAESGAYSRDCSRFPRRRPFVYLNRHTPTGQSRVYRVTQLRTGGVHCRKSAGTGPVVLKVVPVTGAAILQVTMDQLVCASLFPHPPLV